MLCLKCGHKLLDYAEDICICPECDVKITIPEIDALHKDDRSALKTINRYGMWYEEKGVYWINGFIENKKVKCFNSNDYIHKAFVNLMPYKHIDNPKMGLQVTYSICCHDIFQSTLTMSPAEYVEQYGDLCVKYIGLMPNMMLQTSRGVY